MSRDVLLDLSALSEFFHAPDQAVRAHIGPMLVNIFQAGRTAGGLVNNGPAVRHVNKTWPEGMLPLVIDQHVIDAVFIFKRIGHFVLHCCASCEILRWLPS